MKEVTFQELIKEPVGTVFSKLPTGTGHGLHIKGTSAQDNSVFYPSPLDDPEELSENGESPIPFKEVFIPPTYGVCEEQYLIWDDEDIENLIITLQKALEIKKEGNVYDNF